MSHFYKAEYEIWVLGWLANFDWAVKYATFEGNIFVFSWAKKNSSVCTKKKLHNVKLKRQIFLV